MPLQSREDLIADLQSKKFREAFVSSRVSNTLAFQIRAMRQARGWSQAYLAERLGTSQNAIYRLESPQYGKPSITTLKRLASIFDVGLSVWFSPFSKLVDRVTHLSPDDILVPSFDNDPGLQEGVAAPAQIQTTVPLNGNLMLTVSWVHGTNTHQPIIISDSTLVSLNRNNITILGVDKDVIKSHQTPSKVEIVEVSWDNPALPSVQTVEINREGEGRGVRAYAAKLVGTAA